MAKIRCMWLLAVSVERPWVVHDRHVRLVIRRISERIRVVRWRTVRILWHGDVQSASILPGVWLHVNVLVKDYAEWLHMHWLRLLHRGLRLLGRLRLRLMRRCLALSIRT